MFKRLSKAQALREELGEETEETGPVTIETALDEESASEEEFSDDDDDDNDDDEEDEEGDDDEEDEGDVQFTVRDALESPIYLDDEAPGRAEIFRCVACPIVMLKNDKAIEVHAESKNHKRRFHRFVEFAHAESEREGDRVMALDPRTLADLLEDERRAEEKKAPAKRKEPSSTDHVSRVERRKQRRAVRNEKRAGLQEAYAKRMEKEGGASTK